MTNKNNNNNYYSSSSPTDDRATRESSIQIIKEIRSGYYKIWKTLNEYSHMADEDDFESLKDLDRKLTEQETKYGIVSP